METLFKKAFNYLLNIIFYEALKSEHGNMFNLSKSAGQCSTFYLQKLGFHFIKPKP